MRGHDWEAIKAAYPLSEVVGQTVALRKAGRELSGCCPFHQEKTASFFVNDEKAFFHCFGCSAHGDVIDFVARVGGLEPSEAIAKLTGGEVVSLSESDRAARRKWQAEQTEKAAQEREDAIEHAQRRWDRARPVDGANGYLERKGIAPCGARSEGRNLLVPMWDDQGDLINVQTIPPEEGGTKLFQKSAPTVGGRFYIGIAMTGNTIICEGFATGASIFEATAERVCVAFSQGQIENIAREMQAAGVPIIIAADRKALAAMDALGARLGVPVIAPPPNLENGDDFNDQMLEQGVEAVAATFRQGKIDFANRPPPPPEPPFCAITFVDAMSFNEADIPVRPWIVPGAILRGVTHILAAPGGTGKSLFTIQLALMLASGDSWGRWKPKQKCRVLIVNAEDDIDEQRRRISAARIVMDMDTASVRGGIMVADNPSSILVSKPGDKGGNVATPLAEQLQAIVKHHAIDVVIVDPFAETFDGDENSNTDTKWAMKIWRDDIARACNCAVYLVHHTTKNAGDRAGSADVIRGASAVVNSARMAATLFVMTKEEAELLGVDEEKRFRYVRYDDAKANQSLVGARAWFEKVSVTIGNGPAGDSTGADEVGALRPWEPLGAAGYDPEAVMAVLTSLEGGYIDEDGVCTDIPFGLSKAGKSRRWIGYLVQDRMGLEEGKVLAAIRYLTETGMIEEYEFQEEGKSRVSKGVRANLSKAEAVFGALPERVG